MKAGPFRDESCENEKKGKEKKRNYYENVGKYLVRDF
jgi:hypothetical protein